MLIPVLGDQEVDRFSLSLYNRTLALWAVLPGWKIQSAFWMVYQSNQWCYLLPIGSNRGSWLTWQVAILAGERFVQMDMTFLAQAVPKDSDGCHVHRRSYGPSEHAAAYGPALHGPAVLPSRVGLRSAAAWELENTLYNSRIS